VALYLPDQNALFLHVPHTYSELVKTTLADTLGLRTRTVSNKHAHKDMVGTLRFKRNPYTFAFVRHPLDWYASYWQSKMRRDEHWFFWEPDTLWHPAWAIDPGLGDDDFATFVRNVCNRGAYLHETYRLYTGRGTGDEIHYVGKAETLVDDLATILDTLGVEYQPSELADLDQPQTWRRGMYTPELIGLVASAERETFSEYDYVAPARTAGQRADLPLTVDDIPGWFSQIDRDLFRTLLAWQVATEPPGDLVELGCYLGKSTVIVGESLQAGETFTVCDLFGAAAPDDANESENKLFYSTLNQERFERNYRQLRGVLPVVLPMPTSEILEHVKPDSARFVHVDASHMYEHVVGDIEAARTMLRGDGIVVFDDYRSAHTPGVAAAVWGAVLNAGLKPIVLSGMKLYGTWGDPTAARQRIRDWVKGDPLYSLDVQQVAGHEILRVIASVKAKREKSRPKQEQVTAPAPTVTTGAN
jgi:methyltransferase family protein/sulfotransferase famil protein